MNNDHRILHDAYFNKKPRLITLMTVRLALLCALTASSVLMIVDLYGLPCGRLTPALVTCAACAVMYILATLLPPFAAYGGVIILGGGAFFIFREKIWEQLIMFWDCMMLKINGRMLSTEQLVIGELYKLKSGALDKELEEGCLFGVLMIALLFAIIFTAAARTRCRVLAPVILTILFCAPAFAAETAKFTPFAVIFISSVFAHRSVFTSYELDSSFVFDRADAYRKAEKKSERAYKRKTRFWAFSRKTRSDTVRYGKYTSNAVAMMIISTAVFFSAWLIIPPGRGIDYNEILDALSEFGSSAAQKFGELWNDVTGRADERNYFSISGGLGASDSISLSAPPDRDREVLKVTLERNDIPVFMRGDIGVTFTGNGWTSISAEYENAVNADGERYADLLEFLYPEEEYQYFRLALLANTLVPDDVIPLQKVSLEYLRNTRVVFQPLAPYDLDYKKNEYFNSFGDFILRTKSGYVSAFDSMTLTPNITGRTTIGDMYPEGIVRYGRLFDADKKSHDEDYIRTIGIYRDFINDTYLTGDAVVDDFTNEMFLSGYIGYGKSRYANAANMCSYLRKNFDYTLDEKESGGNLYDFLYNTKKGHCAMFASAMTLSLRNMGIPARYVTGYVVSGEGEKTDDGYVYTLCENDLHAWTEVYFEGIGWLPFDPTAPLNDTDDDAPAYDDSDISDTDDTDLPDEDEDTDEQQGSEDDENDAPVEDDDTLPDDEEQPSGGGSQSGTEAGTDSEGGFLTEYLPLMIAAAVLLLLIIFVILFVRAVNRAEKRTFAAFRKKPPTEATKLMYRFILTLLSYSGLTPGSELLFDFAKRVDGDITMKGINVFLRDIVEIIEKCEFGTEEVSPVTEDERKAVYKFAAAVYVRTLEGYNPIRQFFAKISLFM